MSRPRLDPKNPRDHRITFRVPEWIVTEIAESGLTYSEFSYKAVHKAALAKYKDRKKRAERKKAAKAPL